MLRTFALGLLGIALVVLVGVLLVTWATREPSRTGGAEPRRGSAPVADRFTALEERSRQAAALAASPDGSRASAASRLLPARRPPRGAVNHLMASLGALQPSVARCSSGAPSAASSARAVLMLELEPGDGQIRVAGATVHSMGEVSEATVACARALLVGQVLEVPEARPGDRVSIPYPILR